MRREGPLRVSRDRWADKKGTFWASSSFATFSARSTDSMASQLERFSRESHFGAFLAAHDWRRSVPT